jgi:hypothetical protein
MQHRQAVAGVALVLLAGCSADVTGLRVRFEHGDGDVRQYVVHITDAAGNLIHECTWPPAPAATSFTSGETWTVLFDEERAGNVSIEAEAINAEGRRSMRGLLDYYMASLEVARPAVIMTGNLEDVVLPPACVAAAEASLPPHTPRGSLVTVDERGTFVPGPDAGADSGL